MPAVAWAKAWDLSRPSQVQSGAAMGAGDDIIIPGNAQLVSKGCRDSIDHLSRGDNLFLELKKENSKQMGMKSCL